MQKCAMDSLEVENKKSRILECKLRSDLLEDNTINDIKSVWKESSKDFGKNDVKVIKNPFPVCQVRNFVKDPELLKLTAEELKDVHFNEKDNDLYQFKQSDDLCNLTNFTFIPQLYDLIRVEGLTWVKSIVGGSKFSLSATFSCYEYQDRLLCHDDKCEDRHIAFILYLMDDWNEHDGGSLDLFNTDSNGYPSEVVESIIPEFNMMVFFEVTHTSFHQVSEVKSKTKKRLSINGWFHSSGKKLQEPKSVILQDHRILASNKEFDLEEYFSKTYFTMKNKVDIQNLFASQSETELENFIQEKFLEEIETDLRSNGIMWKNKGPANVRKYEIADTSTLPPSLKRLKDIFESISWFKYLTRITGLDLAPLRKTDPKIWAMGTPPVCSFEIQKWTQGCYTLIHDQDPEFLSEALDVVFRVPFEKVEDCIKDEEDSPKAGHIIYIDSTSRDEECLLHLGYKKNSLGLIFRDTETLRFVKYLDSTAKPFYLILCTYRQWKSGTGSNDSEDSCSDNLSSGE